MHKLLVSSSPHIKSPQTTESIMLYVIIALFPSMVAAVVIFGTKAIWLMATCVISAVASEALARFLMKRDVGTVLDLSAVVTGLILALNLPVTFPLWMAAVGSAFAIIVVKQLFGGIGQNVINPAAAARIFLLISFSGQMTLYVTPFRPDAIAEATLLGILKEHPDVVTGNNYLSLFLGNKAGVMGEVCGLAIVIGFVFLVATKVIRPHAPVAFAVTFMGLYYLMGKDGLYMLLLGGALFGAVFMMTDYTTTPVTDWGKIIFGVGCAVITVLIRQFGSYPEGISFSIVLMNILVPYIDKWTKRRVFGTGREKA